MNDYFELQIKINPDLADVVSDICFENFECDGVVLAEETYKDLEMVSTTEGTLKAYIKSVDDVERVLIAARSELKKRGFSENDLGSWEYSYSKVENQDWSKKWKEKWDITRVSDKIVVVPDWIEYNKQPDEVVIRLEPGCAFGTGTHETTQLCMKACEKYMPADAEVADIGTGSGILAVCAKKLGAKSVFGIDNDDTVIDVAAENAFKNDVEASFALATVDKLDSEYDFVFANILHNVLAEIMHDLKKIMKKDAIMVLSGILDEKKGVVLDAIEKNGLYIVEEIHQNQWVAFVVTKREN